MTTFTLVATGTTDLSLNDVEARVRDVLASAGVSLIPCEWAPDVDTISDAVGGGVVELVDLN